MNLRKLKELFQKKLKNYPTEEVDSFFYLSIANKLQLKRIDYLLEPTKEINPDISNELIHIIDLLVTNKPIQHILGTTEFCNLTFNVTKDTLIPRPETEELIYWITEDYKNTYKSLKILDIGTGSGCIAISLSKLIPSAEVWAFDISEKALDIAKNNANLNSVNIHFQKVDILTLSELPTSFDIIVSNPPYIRELEKKEIQKNVLDYEPHSALFVPNKNPLLFYKHIIGLAQKNLVNNGKLYFEINQYLGKETLSLLKGNGFINSILKKDIFDNDRMTRSIKQ